MVDVVPAQLSYSFEREVEYGTPSEAEPSGPAGGEALPEPETGHADLGQERIQGPGWGFHGWDEDSIDPTVHVSPGTKGGLGSRRAQLDPELGPLDLGYPLLVDLGAGEAPYDDGVPTIHGVELTRGGFSDALLQASWRENLTGSSMLHTTVAVTRYQDLGMLDGLGDMRFAWLVFGWQTSF